MNALKSQTGLIVGHWISFGVTLVMMIVVDIMSCTGLKRRKKLKGCFRKYGPLILCLISTVFILAEPTRHILSDNGIWPLCWEGAIPRINQTWNDGCVVSSLEYKCNLPCCIPMESYMEEYPNDDPPAGTRNESELVLDDPAWAGHFFYPYCQNPINNETIPYLNNVTGKPNCDQPKDSVDYQYHGPAPLIDDTQYEYITRLECRCDACVIDETMQYLAPVGWIFTVTLTYTGFVLLAIGALWNANIVAKLKKLKGKCAELKAQREALDGDEVVAKRATTTSTHGSEDGKEVKEIGGSDFGDLNFGEPQAEDCED